MDHVTALYTVIQKSCIMKWFEMVCDFEWLHILYILLPIAALHQEHERLIRKYFIILPLYLKA